MSDDKDLRASVTKLAYENPQLREHLLPILASQDKTSESDAEYRKGMAVDAVADAEAEIDSFLKDLIRAGKDINKALEKHVKSIEEDGGGLKVNLKDVHANVLAHIQKGVWGNDEMTKLLARMIVYGHFVD